MCERSLRSLSRMFPNARVMIGFRPHRSYIASGYKQYLREGGTGTFEEFYDPFEDSGFMKSASFVYRNKIDWIRSFFDTEPFVYTADELRGDLTEFLDALVAFLGGKVTVEPDVTSEKVNRGVKLYQTPVLRYLNRFRKSYLNPSGRYRFRGRFLDAFELNPAGISQRWLWFLPDGDFWTPERAAQVEQKFADDWSYVLECVAERGDVIQRGFTPKPADSRKDSGAPTVPGVAATS